jgi:competence ComEA-like helix-hairpin-helix protein
MLAHLCRLLFVFLVLLGTALGAVNVNTATSTELQSLPGIGPAKATAIMDYRAQNGLFTNVEQLDNVPGIGPATMANIRPLVVLSEGDQPTAAPMPEESPAPTAETNLVNINTATAAALETLPGIGPAKAGAIVTDRSANGPFTSCDALQRVHGVGPATVKGLLFACSVN